LARLHASAARIGDIGTTGGGARTLSRIAASCQHRRVFDRAASEPQSPASPLRAELPDLARALALIGIALVNVQLFAYPSAVGYSDGALRDGVDRAAWLFVAALFLFKSYTLFSGMFGAGFGVQMSAADRAGASFGARYLRRLLGLLLLGLCNLALLFYGDILVMYAGLGALLLVFRSASPERLLRAGVAVYGVQVVVLALLVVGAALGSIEMSPDEVAAQRADTVRAAAEARASFLASGFLDVTSHRVQTWLLEIPIGLLVQGFGAFACFLWGLAAQRSGLIDQPADEFWIRCRRVYFPVGVGLSVVAALLQRDGGDASNPREIAGLALTTLAAPLATLGYLGALAGWVTSGFTPRLRAFLALAGGASLTAYLLQGLLLSWIFSGYGFGLYGSLGAGACVAIAAGVALLSVVFCALWRARFARGPVEELLRRWTYLGSAPRA
jgi:uncharacterized protein